MSTKKNPKKDGRKKKSGLMGKILHYQTRHVIYNIYTYLRKRKLDPTTYEHQNDINVVKTISDMTGFSNSSISRTTRKGNAMKMEDINFSFKTDDKKHVRKKRIAVDKTMEGTIRRKIIQYYNMKNEVPSIRKLNSILKKEKILECSNEFLRQLLHRLGFTNDVNLDVLMEREDLVARRLDYLRAMQQYRSDDKSIFFFNDTSFWAEYDDAHYNMDTLPIIIMVHFSGTNGFKDLQIVKLKGKPAEEDEGFQHFEIFDWVKDTILPKLPDSSVIVMNTPNTKPTEAEEKLSTASTRGEMQAWLTRHYIPFKETNTKMKLYQKIVEHRERMETSIAKLLKEYNHEVLYLPGNVSDLNPTLLVWDNLKGCTENTLPNTLFIQYPTDKWHKYFNEVKKNEKEYYLHDVKMDRPGPPSNEETIHKIKEEEYDVIIELDLDSIKSSIPKNMEIVDFDTDSVIKLS